MKHCRLSLPFVASRWSPVTLSLVLACTASSGDATLLIDSTSLRESTEVIAVPVDPKTLGTRPAAPARPVSLADTLATAAVLRDTADRLDAAFQRERDLLNAEARDLASLPAATRHSSGYARRYQAFASRLDAAHRVRVARDSLRARANRLHAPPATPDSAARNSLLHAADGRRRTVVARAAPVVRLRLEPGEWWIALADDRQRPGRFARVTIAGRADTIRVPAP